jgi:hypothetical protein
VSRHRRRSRDGPDGSRRPEDAALRVRLRELAAERRRFGYRRTHVLHLEGVN